MEGLLDHAVSHHLSCPWDFPTHMKLYAEAKKTLKDPDWPNSPPSTSWTSWPTRM